MKLEPLLDAWHDATFPAALKQTLELLPAKALPLQQATTQGGLVAATGHEVTVLQVKGTDDRIHAETGVFFNEIVGGCSCGDDPLEARAYCRMAVDIDRQTGEALFTLLPE
jgi:hypothetical protein